MKEQILSALNKCYFFLKFRPRSKKEMIDYLQKKARRFKWPESTIVRTIGQLEEGGLIDDKKFIEWFVNQKIARKPKSKFLIQKELQRFGIDKFLVEDFFANNLLDEEAWVREILDRKWNSWSGLDKRKRFGKAAKLLQRKGFSYGLIKKTIVELEEALK